jgi:NAD(P)H-flavin reductase
LVESLFKPRLMRIINAGRNPDVRTCSFLRRRRPEVSGCPASSGFSVFGTGEAVFTMANSPTRDEFVECGFRAIGKVTMGLRNLSLGQVIGFRGPYGNTFPVDAWKGKDLAFIGGGIGTVALRAIIQWVLDHREEYGEILILNGARTVADVCYKQEMPSWAEIPNVKVVRTVDPGGETSDWDGEVGLLPNVFEKLAVSPENRVVITCGPPIMLHYLFRSLEKLKFSPENVVTTLENKMKCGLGLCGRCNVGRYYVCVDGPVFTWAQLQTMPKDF